MNEEEKEFKFELNEFEAERSEDYTYREYMYNRYLENDMENYLWYS